MIGVTRWDEFYTARSATTTNENGIRGSDDDPSARRLGASAHRVGEPGPRAGEVLRRATAGLQCTQPDSGKSRRAESGTATGPGAVAVGHRRAERAHLRVRRSDRSLGGSELSASRAAETDQRSGHAHRADLSADAGRSASLRQEPRRGRLSGAAARAKKLGRERAADAYQQGR